MAQNCWLMFVSRLLTIGLDIEGDEIDLKSVDVVRRNEPIGDLLFP
jgi:hypothetical protein